MRYGLQPDYLRTINWDFIWDKEGGFCCDIVRYGPWDQFSQLWMVPGTLEHDLEPSRFEEEEQEEDVAD